DVTLDKAPGRSHEIEIRIVSRNALDVILNREQGNIQQDLVRMREQQRDASKKVAEAEKSLDQNKRLTPDDVAQLLQVEHTQRQMAERIGTKQDGLRAEAQRVLDSLRNNHLPRSAADERMEMVTSELQRLAKEELEPIESRLTRVRKQSEAADPAKSAKDDKKLLGETRQHQEEVEKTLTDLLSRMEPWSSTREIKSEAKALLQEQRKFNEETDSLQKNLGSIGSNREELNADQRAELDKASAAQHKLQERTNQLLDKMQRVSKDREDKDPQTARELKNAVDQATNSNVTGLMGAAKEQIEQNKLRNAGDTQRQ